jgi:hypothetical protein
MSASAASALPAFLLPLPPTSLWLACSAGVLPADRGGESLRAAVAGSASGGLGAVASAPAPMPSHDGINAHESAAPEAPR